MKRTDFCTSMAAMTALSVAHIPVRGALRAGASQAGGGKARISVDVAAIDRDRVIRNAKRYLTEEPVTITASHSNRTPGGLHDFFSEGDYWWPDPKAPNGPYIRRDGESNPDNFVAHRQALVRLSVMMPALMVAWKLTGDTVYAAEAREHVIARLIQQAVGTRVAIPAPPLAHCLDADPSSEARAVAVKPLAPRRMMRERSARACAVFLRHDHPCSVARSASVNTNPGKLRPRPIATLLP
jgi:hypothetical protein